MPQVYNSPYSVIQAAWYPPKDNLVITKLVIAAASLGIFYYLVSVSYPNLPNSPLPHV